MGGRVILRLLLKDMLVESLTDFKAVSLGSQVRYGCILPSMGMSFLGNLSHTPPIFIVRLVNCPAPHTSPFVHLRVSEAISSRDEVVSVYSSVVL